jgi:hypothetical protein
MLFFVKLLAISVTLILSCVATADVSKISAEYFSQLYAKTCVKEAADMAVLKSRFGEAQAPELSNNKAVLFLEGKLGTVWIIPNVIGDYLVSIDDSNICTVYTRDVNINEVERAFMSLFENIANIQSVEKVQDETLQTELGPKHYISYTLTNQADNSRQKFSLETSTADRVEIQAKATVGAVIN